MDISSCYVSLLSAIQSGTRSVELCKESTGLFRASWPMADSIIGNYAAYRPYILAFAFIIVSSKWYY